MKQVFIGFIILLVLFSCLSNKKKDEVYVVRQPAEFETQQAIWLIWPSNNHKRSESVEKVTLSIIAAIIGTEKIVVTCRDTMLFAHAIEILTKNFGKNKNLRIRVLPSHQIWVRDMGPIYVETNKNTFAVADFNFNSWGYGDTLDADTKTEEMYDKRVASFFKLPVIHSNMISEGGSREVNGRGILMTTEAVEVNRNPRMSKQQMEAEYKRLLGVKKVIWLKQGLVADDHTFLSPIKTADGTKAYTVVTTNGHIDEFARFVNDSTILLAKVDSAVFNDPIALEDHKRLEENYKILSTATNHNGRPFTIIRMPLPHSIYTTMNPGDYVYDYIKTLDYQSGTIFPKGKTIKVIAALSYLNFIIANSVIIGQTSWRKGMPNELKLQDENAAKILASVFPNRRVIMIDALAVNLGGGGIHCISIQQPASPSNKNKE